jgi:hypothetical protein
VQLVSSGITHRTSLRASFLSGLALRVKRRVELPSGDEARVRRVAGEPGCDRNPYLRVNLGVLAFDRDADGSRTVRALFYGRDGDEPRLVYRSPPI